MATELERLHVLIEANTRSYERAMRRLEQKTDRAVRASRRQFSGLDRSLRQTQSLAASFSKGFLGGFAVGGIAALPVAIARATSEMAQLVDTADKLGIGVERLQEMRFAGQQVGVAVNTVDLALQRFTRRLGEAQQGKGELVGILKQYNIALTDAQGRTRAATEVLRDLADATRRAQSPQ
ncbi:MAG: hypothetical protein D6773_00330, partial [Alphaproteobacteria bacterium]